MGHTPIPYSLTHQSQVKFIILQILIGKLFLLNKLPKNRDNLGFLCLTNEILGSLQVLKITGAVFKISESL